MDALKEGIQVKNMAKHMEFITDTSAKKELDEN